MIDDFEIKGKWFLPNRGKDTSIPGILKFSQKESSKLELLGSFNSKKDEHEIIHGIGSNNKAITLYRTFITKKDNMFSEMEMETYVCNVILIGGWFEDKSDLKFKKASASFTYLDDWLNISDGFQFETDPNEFKTKIEYKLPSFDKINILNNFTIQINPTAKGPVRRRNQKEASISQKMYINFNSNRQRSFQEYLRLITHYQTFLQICTQKSVFIDRLSMYFKTQESNDLHRTEIYFQLNHTPELKAELFNFDMILSYKDIRNEYDKIIKRWYHLMPKLNTSLIPYNSVFNAPFLYVSDKLLNLCRAVEAFHRDYQGNKKAYFLDRCIHVFKMNSKVYNHVLKIRSIPEFAKRIKDLRNDFTHSNPIVSKNKNVLKTHRYSEYMKLIIGCAYLVETGVNKDTLKTNISNTRLYNHYKKK